MSRRLATGLAAATLAVALASCSDTTAPDPTVATTVVPSADSVAFAALGQVAVVSAMVLDQYGAPMPAEDVGWTSSADAVATVTDDGIVTAVANGEATLAATSGAASARVVVSVQQVATALVLAPDSLVLGDPGDTGQLSMAAFDARGAPVAMPPVTWSTADPSIAIVVLVHNHANF